MIKLGIIGAMDVEVATLKEKMRDVTVTERTSMVYYEGTLEGLDVVVVQCGIGKVNAAMCTQILCDCFGVTHILNTGIAGSLCADLDIADMVISEDVIHHDFDLRFWGRPVGQVPGMDVTAFPADEMLKNMALEAAEALAAKGYTARVLDMHTIKPLDVDAVNACIADIGKIITVEDHNILNGLGSAVADVVAESGKAVLRRIGVQDQYLSLIHI